METCHIPAVNNLHTSTRMRTTTFSSAGLDLTKAIADSVLSGHLDAVWC